MRLLFFLRLAFVNYMSSTHNAPRALTSLEAGGMGGLIIFVAANCVSLIPTP